MRAMWLALVFMASLLGGCGDETADKGPAPMCFEVDFEAECPTYGYEHIGRRWAYPDLSFTITVDTESPPPTDERGEPRLTSTWCALDADDPEASRSIRLTPLFVDRAGGWVAEDGRSGNLYSVGHPLDFDADPPIMESLHCMDVSLPAYRRRVIQGESDQNTHWYENRFEVTYL